LLEDQSDICLIISNFKRIKPYKFYGYRYNMQLRGERKGHLLSQDRLFLISCFVFSDT